MIYKVYFNNRLICISSLEKDIQLTKESIICKSTKSFDKAYKEFLNDESINELNIFCPNAETFFKHLKKKFKVIKAAGGAALNNDGELLIIKRLGKWDLPKGKIEKGESKKQAALREVEEECGVSNLNIVSKIGKTYHIYELNGEEILKISYWYKMLYSGNEIPLPQTAESITEAIWVKKHEIEKLIENTHQNLVDLFSIFQKI